MPKQLLFGALEEKPGHGAKRRWRDVAVVDIKAVGVNDDLAQDRLPSLPLWEVFPEKGGPHKASLLLRQCKHDTILKSLYPGYYVPKDNINI